MLKYSKIVQPTVEIHDGNNCFYHDQTKASPLEAPGMEQGTLGSPSHLFSRPQASVFAIPLSPWAPIKKPCEWQLTCLLKLTSTPNGNVGLGLGVHSVSLFYTVDTLGQF